MQLKEQLTKVFEKKRLVIWYDRSNEFGETVEELLPEGVELIRIARNEFGIKTRIYTEKERKFLLYSNGHKPEPQENWLLDVLIAGHEFSAERVALWMQELGLPEGFRPFVEARMQFFNSEARRRKLETLLKKEEEKLTEARLALLMTVVVTGGLPLMEDILTVLLKDDSEGGDKFAQLQKYGLMDHIATYLDTVFRMKEKFDSVSVLAAFLFSNEFERHIPREGQKFTSRPGEWSPAAASFFNNWMNNSSQMEIFDHYSKQFGKGNGIAGKITAHDYERFIECKAPEEVEREIVRGLANAVVNRSVKSDRIGEITGIRRYFFYFNGYEHLYRGLHQAALLLETVKLNPPSFRTAGEGFKYYQQYGALIDGCYRRYYTAVKGKQHETVLEKVTAAVEQVYLQSFIFNLEVAWKKAVEAREKWQFPTLLMQNRFYDSYIQPLRGTEKKIFVIISDALRYEAAVELTERLLKLDRTEAKLEMMAGVVPGYTQLGMAALLPNSSLGIPAGGDSATVDGKPAGAQYREARLTERNPKTKVFTAQAFTAMQQEEGRDAVRSVEVVYIYHNKIDATGDDKTSEDDAFEAVSGAYSDIENIIRKIAQFNGNNVLITADHGFYFQQTKLAESDFIDSSAYGRVEQVKRRVVFGRDLITDDNVIRFTAPQLGIESEYDFLFPVGRRNFRLAGAGSRFVHGGLSLQEVAIPVIKFTKKRSTDTEPVGITIIQRSSNLITSNNPVFDLMQTKPVGDRVREREVIVGIYAADDTLLSDEQTHLFDLQGNDSRQLMKTVRFVMRGNISKYNNTPVALIVRDRDPRPMYDPVIARLDLVLSISISNDFDGF
ncbi:MAG: BREX-1 system phosphatase PglZ type A [Chlorobiota bacterium]|nr:MAG: BREX-1 system phosphatase PglZ type A [Chlorobiota bacterium]